MLSDILQRGPGQLVAVIRDLDTDLLAETMVALANADGGTVIVGVDAAGRASGAIYPEEMAGAIQVAVRQSRPLVQVEWRQEEIAGGFAFFINVPRSTELHSLADGRVVIRSRDENRPLSGEEIRQLASTKSTGEYEEQLVPGARREDLDDEVIKEFIARWEEKQGREWTRTADEMLAQVGAVDERGRPTVVGLLLFGREPQVFMPHSGLVFVKFPGTEPRGEGGQAGYGRREEIGGPLARVLQRVWTVVMDEMRTGRWSRGWSGRSKRNTRPPPSARRW